MVASASTTTPTIGSVLHLFLDGKSGIRADAFDNFTVSDGGTTFSAMHSGTWMIIVLFKWNPGPLNSDGVLLSLDYLADSEGTLLSGRPITLTS